MHRETIVTILGLLVTVSLFIGLPITWLRIILPIVGLVIVFIGVTLRSRRKLSFPRTQVEEITH